MKRQVAIPIACHLKKVSVVIPKCLHPAGCDATTCITSGKTGKGKTGMMMSGEAGRCVASVLREMPISIRTAGKEFMERVSTRRGAL